MKETFNTPIPVILQNKYIKQNELVGPLFFHSEYPYYDNRDIVEDCKYIRIDSHSFVTLFGYVKHYPGMPKLNMLVTHEDVAELGLIMSNRTVVLDTSKDNILKMYVFNANPNSVIIDVGVEFACLVPQIVMRTNVLTRDEDGSIPEDNVNHIGQPYVSAVHNWGWY